MLHLTWKKKQTISFSTHKDFIIFLYNFINNIIDSTDAMVGSEFKKLHYLLVFSCMRLWHHHLVICGTADTEAARKSAFNWKSFFLCLSSQQKDFVGLSFPSISSVGPNGAIIHYRWAVLIYLTIHSFFFFLCCYLIVFKISVTFWSVF